MKKRHDGRTYLPPIAGLLVEICSISLCESDATKLLPVVPKRMSKKSLTSF
jgi:hypothetical protein